MVTDAFKQEVQLSGIMQYLSCYKLEIFIKCITTLASCSWQSWLFGMLYHLVMTTPTLVGHVFYSTQLVKKMTIGYRARVGPGYTG